MPGDPRLTGESLGGETILLVEDEEMLAELLVSILERKGYRVIAVGDEQHAVEQFTRRREEITLVLTDCGLPSGSGASVLRRVRALDPAARVILISGAPHAGTATELRDAGAAMLLTKPIHPNELARAIREVIDSPPPPSRGLSPEQVV